MKNSNFSISRYKDEKIAELEKNLASLETEKKKTESQQEPVTDVIKALEDEQMILDTKLEMHRIKPEDYKKQMMELQTRIGRMKTENEVDFDHAKTLWMEVAHLNEQIIQYREMIETVKELGINHLQALILEHPNSAVFKSSFRNDLLYNIITRFKDFANVDSYNFIIKPNKTNAKDTEHPYVVVAEATLSMQQGSASTCSR